MLLKQHDKSWCDLNKPKAISPRPIGILGYESIITRLTKLILRTLKAAYLYATRRFSWRLSWVQAAR